MRFLQAFSVTLLAVPALGATNKGINPLVCKAISDIVKSVTAVSTATPFCSSYLKISTSTSTVTSGTPVTATTTITAATSTITPAESTVTSELSIIATETITAPASTITPDPSTVTGSTQTSTTCTTAPTPVKLRAFKRIPSTTKATTTSSKSTAKSNPLTAIVPALLSSACSCLNLPTPTSTTTIFTPTTVSTSTSFTTPLYTAAASTTTLIIPTTVSTSTQTITPPPSTALASTSTVTPVSTVTNTFSLGATCSVGNGRDVGSACCGAGKCNAPFNFNGGSTGTCQTCATSGNFCGSDSDCCNGPCIGATNFGASLCLN